MQWSWQIAYMSYVVTMDDRGAIFREPPRLDADQPLNPRVEGPSNRPPCGRGGTVSEAYGSVLGEEGVCGENRTDAETRAGVPSLRRGGSVTVRYRVVRAILGCKEEREELGGTFEGGPSSGGNDMSPQRVPSDYMLGDEEFQMRGFVIGGMQFNRNDRGVQVASGGRNPGGGGVYGALVNLGRISVAQAEFYYGGTEDHSEWLWNMKWRGRLRRFRMPPELAGSGGGSRLEAACSNSESGGGGGCGGAGGLDLSGLEGVIVH